MCTVEKCGQVFILTLTGDSEHRFSPSLISEIRSFVVQIHSETLASPDRSDALVTATHDKFFSNDFDFAYATAALTTVEFASRLTQWSRTSPPLSPTSFPLPMPTIAMVTGHAAAASLMLALAHDFIVMRGDGGVLYLSEVDMRLPIPSYFLAIKREKVRDFRIFKDMVMKARKVGSKKAAEAGVVALVKGSGEETIEAAAAMAEEFVKRKWNGRLYASIRMGSVPGSAGRLN